MMTTPREIFFEPLEYEKRVIQLQDALAAGGIDLLVTCAPGNICYLNGYVSVNVLDIMFVAVPAHGKPVFYLWQFERGRAESTVTGMETVCWDTGVDPIEFLVNDLTHRGYKKGRIGIDTGSTHTSFDTVQQLLSHLEGQPTKGVVEKLRRAGVRMEAESSTRNAGPGPLNGMRFVVTGRLSSMSRSEAESRIKEMGGAVASSMASASLVGSDQSPPLASARTVPEVRL